MIPEIFADGVGEVGFGGGMVRIDLVSLSVTDNDADGNPKREVRQRLVMTPQGFLETYASMQGMLEKLVELGVVQPQSAPDAPQETAETDEAGQPKSPNF